MRYEVEEARMDPLDGLTCSVLIRADDPVLRGHLVHGVPILPGVALLDMTYRILRARRIDPAGAELRRLLFHRPVAPGDGFDVDLEFRFTGSAGRYRIAVRGAPVFRDGTRGQPLDVLDGDLLVGAECPTHRLDAAALRDGADAQASMAELY